MPRYSLGKTKLSVKDRAQRARSFRVWGFRRWIDPFPNIHGTLPEKMVYAALSRRGIQFYFLGNVRIAIPEIDLFKTYQADFIIPGMKLIIEVQGAFWHTKPATLEADAFKFALYQHSGYRVLSWWDFDIIDNVEKLFATEPAFAGLSGLASSASSELSPVDRTKVDSSKGIRTLNRRRAARNVYRKPPPRFR